MDDDLVDKVVESVLKRDTRRNKRYNKRGYRRKFYRSHANHKFEYAFTHDEIETLLHQSTTTHMMEPLYHMFFYDHYMLYTYEELDETLKSLENVLT